MGERRKGEGEREREREKERKKNSLFSLSHRLSSSAAPDVRPHDSQPSSMHPRLDMMGGVCSGARRGAAVR